MSEWETLLNKVNVASGPNTYITVQYRYKRDGADMLYDVYVKGELQYKDSYRNDSCGLDIRLDDGSTTSGTYTDRYYKSTWKASGSGHWPVSQTFSFRLSNKVTGNLKLYIRFWDSQGATGFDYDKTWTNLIVSPAGPILSMGTISKYINHLEINLSNTITGAMTNYEVARVSDGVVVKSGSLSSVTSFTVDMLGLTPNTSYNGTWKARAYANGCWGNWLTLSSTSLKTNQLPTANINSSSVTLGGNQTLSLSSTTDITSFQYELRTTKDNTLVKSESGITSSPKTITLSSTQINTVLSKYTDTTTAGCKIITKAISNGTTYTLNENSFNYSIPNTYKPTFNDSYVSDIKDILNSSITGDETKFIQNHNRLQLTITPMIHNGYSTGGNYIITNGTKTTSKSYSEDEQDATLDNVSETSLSIVASDSRGFTSSVNKSINIIPYNNPTYTELNIIRQNGIGTFAVLSAKGKYTNWSGLTTTNKIKSVKYKWKLSTDSTYSNLIDITDLLTVNSGGNWELNGTLAVSFGASNKYDIVLVFNDVLETITTPIVRLSTAEVLIWKDLLNKRVGINKKPDYTFDVDGTINGLTIQGNILSANSYGLFPNGFRGKTLNGGSGTAGYMYVCDITTTGTYQNQYISFDVLQRSRKGHVDLQFVSNSTSGALSISDIKKQGNINVYYTNANNVFSLYIQKSEAYDNIEIENLQKGQYMASTTITWKNTTVTSLPSGYVSVTTNCLLNDIYPVGSIYLSINTTNPGTLFGGTWERITDGYLWATSSSNGGGKGGSLTTGSTVLTVDQIPAHGHSIASSGAHSHSSQGRKNSGSSGGTVFESYDGAGSYRTVRVPRSGTDGAHTHTASDTGGGQGHTHSINPSYVNVIMWKRTA